MKTKIAIGHYHWTAQHERVTLKFQIVCIHIVKFQSCQELAACFTAVDNSNVMILNDQQDRYK